MRKTTDIEKIKMYVFTYMVSKIDKDDYNKISVDSIQDDLNRMSEKEILFLYRKIKNGDIRSKLNLVLSVLIQVCSFVTVFHIDNENPYKWIIYTSHILVCFISSSIFFNSLKKSSRYLPYG